ncbi:MAG: AAA family ATPase [Gemmataceae bacterium]|nr:AAA family ATPase [Gemmataceae bacterium]
MKFPDLSVLRKEISQTAKAIPFGMKIPVHKLPEIQSILRDICVQYNDSCFEIKIQNGTIDLSHRAIILAIVGAKLCLALLEYHSFYSRVWKILTSEGLDQKELKKIFSGELPSYIDTPNHRRVMDQVDKQANREQLSQLEKEHLIKFGCDLSWSGCDGKGIYRENDFFVGAVCNSLNVNTTQQVRLGELSKYFTVPEAEPIRNDLDRLLSTTSSAQTVVSPSGNNTIFFGPPGTGKSYAVKSQFQNAQHIRITFHPEYTYADFFGSYRPVVGADQQVRIKGFDGKEIAKPVNYFHFVPGPFIQSFILALKEPHQEVCLIIEEINRGDCAAIFGDLFQLLDRDINGRSEYELELKPELQEYLSKQSDLPQIQRLFLPANLSLIATMNTSDQSLFPMDSAFKRRWNWKYVAIDLSIHQGVVLQDNHQQWNWPKLVSAINARIIRSQREDKQIGQWFIKPINSKPNAYIDPEMFISKCLFYLWHDVFKDEPTSEESPFLADGSLTSFDTLRDTFSKGGLAFIFKPEILAESQFLHQPNLTAQDQTLPPV